MNNQQKRCRCGSIKHLRIFSKDCPVGLAIRKAKKLSLEIAPSKLEAKKSAEDASAEKEIKCLAAEAAGGGWKIRWGGIIRICGITRCWGSEATEDGYWLDLLLYLKVGSYWVAGLCIGWLDRIGWIVSLYRCIAVSLDIAGSGSYRLVWLNLIGWIRLDNNGWMRTHSFCKDGMDRTDGTNGNDD